MSIFWSIQTFDPKQTSEATQLVYNEILAYVQSFLVSQHPHRGGTMCPFVPKALKYDRIFFSESSKRDNARGHKEKIIECINFFKAESATTDVLGSLIILFPSNYEISKLLEIHRDNRMLCIRNGLMMGALYPTNQAPSLHNKEYYPSRTPSPTLVLRNMVPNDLVFLGPSLEISKNKLVFLHIFLSLFRKDSAVNIQKYITDAEHLYQKYTRKLYRERAMKLAILSFCSVVAFLLLSFIMA